MYANLSISASACILHLSVIGVIAVNTPSTSASDIVAFADDVTAGACSRRELYSELVALLLCRPAGVKAVPLETFMASVHLLTMLDGVGGDCSLDFCEFADVGVCAGVC